MSCLHLQGLVGGGSARTACSTFAPWHTLTMWTCSVQPPSVSQNSARNVSFERGIDAMHCMLQLTHKIPNAPLGTAAVTVRWRILDTKWWEISCSHCSHRDVFMLFWNLPYFFELPRLPAAIDNILPQSHLKWLVGYVGSSFHWLLEKLVFSLGKLRLYFSLRPAASSQKKFWEC